MGECNGFPARFGARCSLPLAALASLACLLTACAQQPERGVATTSGTSQWSVEATQAKALRPVKDPQHARSASALSLRTDAPLRYVVKKGDTLWGIAGYYLRNPWEWPQLWYDNPQIKNPHLIYPGDVLRMVWVKGRPRVTEEARVKVLKPQVRRMPLKHATPGIPYAAIRNFIKGPKVVDAVEIDHAPYVVAFTKSHLIGSAGDGVFVKGLPKHPASMWTIVHIGKEYRDPDTGAILGYQAIPTGRCTLEKAGPVALLRIISNQRETLVGDRLLPLTRAQFRASFFPHPPKKSLNGSIISVFGGLNEVGQHDIVTLDRGSDAGLDAGTVLRIMHPSREVRDPYGSPESTVLLPPQPAGLLMVFKTSPHVAYGLVMNVTAPVRVLDTVEAPDSGD